MRKSVLLPFLAWSLTLPALPLWAQQARPDAAAALAEVCAKTLCRKASRTLDLRVDDRRYYRTETKTYPFLDPDGAVIIYPGETVTITFDNKDGLGQASLVKASEPGEPADGAPVPNAVFFQFSQMDGKPDMMLRATNRTGLMLKYDALMFVPTENGVRNAKTSSCPLLTAPPGAAPEFGAYEHWPHPIIMLVLTNFRILPSDGDTFSCN